MIVNNRTSCYLVLTLVIGEESEEIYSLSRSFLQSYAKRIGADFACIRENVYSDARVPPHYNKLRIKEYLEHYDRVLFLDCDIIVLSTTPNLFDLVPEDVIGVVNEGALVNRCEAIKQVKNAFGEIENWQTEYFNSGVILVSKLHQNLFITPKVFYLGLFREQSYLNWQARSLKYKIYYLDKQYNYFFHPGASLSSATLASLVHFAGWGFQLPRNQEDSKHTYKYHQMKCFLSYLSGQVITRVNPEQLCLISGFIDKKASLRKFTVTQEHQGLVSHGPYLEVNKGLYKIIIDFELHFDNKPYNNQAIAFIFDIVSNAGNQIWYRSAILVEQKHVEIIIDLLDIKDLEIRFYATGISFSLNFIEIVLLDSASRTSIEVSTKIKSLSSLVRKLVAQKSKF